MFHLIHFDIFEAYFQGSCINKFQFIYLSKKANKIFVASYWPNVLDWAKADSFEHNLTKNMIAVPVDQRYNSYLLEKIIKQIK